ncbi:hypothetical protein [Mycobacterium sp. URHB0021]|jgi:hypothetical protein
MPRADELSAIGYADDTRPLVCAEDSTTDTAPRTERRPALGGFGAVLGALVVLLIGGAVAGLVSSGARHQLAMSFTEQPQRYTELYFSSATAAPIKDGSSRLAVTVSFVVTNHQGQVVEYPFAVTLVDADDRPVAGTTGTVAVPESASTTPSAVVDVPGSAQWTAIEVSLTGRSEQLHVLRSQFVAADG